MEIIWAIAAFICLFAGLLGAIIPVIPGLPLSYLGLLLLHWSGIGRFSPPFLWIWLAIVAAITVMDFFLPAWMTKKFGGSKLAVFGSVIGLIVGILFFPPAGIIIGPFLGALTGELINSGGIRAVKAALGAFLAFIAGTGAKLVASSLMIYYAVKAVL